MPHLVGSRKLLKNLHTLEPEAFAGEGVHGCHCSRGWVMVSQDRAPPAIKYPRWICQNKRVVTEDRLRPPWITPWKHGTTFSAVIFCSQGHTRRGRARQAPDRPTDRPRRRSDSPEARGAHPLPPPEHRPLLRLYWWICELYLSSSPLSFAFLSFSYGCICLTSIFIQ